MKVLLTGASGNVGRLLATEMAESFMLRLADVRPPESVPAAAELIVDDLADPETMRRAVDGVGAVVHLAGNPDFNASWQEVAAANVDLTELVLRAALAAGVRRVVLASSVHAMGGYVRDGTVPVAGDWPTHPCCLYGASKVAAESVGKVYAHRYGLPVVCLRLGWVVSQPARSIGADLWLSPRDLCDLVSCALTGEVQWGTYFGMSANTRLRWDISPAVNDLGYRPHDNAEHIVVDPNQPRAVGDECFT